jgi:hypothetical protein
MAEFLSRDTFKAGLVSEGQVTVPTTPATGTDATSKSYVDGKSEVFAQTAAPTPGSAAVVWVDIDDTTLAGSVLAVAWLRWTGTQAQYDAITPKDSNTLYVVI